MILINWNNKCSQWTIIYFKWLLSSRGLYSTLFTKWWHPLSTNSFNSNWVMYLLTPWDFLLCKFKLSILAHLNWHISQANGFSLVWTDRMCILSLELSGNLFSQYSQWKFRSLRCTIFLCLLNFMMVVNNLPHSGHGKGVSLCRSMCRCK